MIRSIATAAILVLATQAVSARAATAAEPFEGVWARTMKECRDKEGPNSRTFIDLSGKEDGKPAPLFDQYEHHCRIEKTDRAGATVKLSMVCYEFWDDYRANKDSRQEDVTLASLGKSRLKMNGKTYVRCRD